MCMFSLENGEQMILRYIYFAFQHFSITLLNYFPLIYSPEAGQIIVFSVKCCLAFILSLSLSINKLCFFVNSLIVKDSYFP